MHNRRRRDGKIIELTLRYPSVYQIDESLAITTPSDYQQYFARPHSPGPTHVSFRSADVTIIGNSFTTSIIPHSNPTVAPPQSHGNYQPDKYQPLSCMRCTPTANQSPNQPNAVSPSQSLRMISDSPRSPCDLIRQKSLLPAQQSAPRHYPEALNLSC